VRVRVRVRVRRTLTNNLADLSVLGKKKGLDCPEGSSYHFYDFLRYSPHHCFFFYYYYLFIYCSFIINYLFISTRVLRGWTFRILKDLRRLCDSDSHHVFFLLENVASMSRKDKTKISGARSLSSPPHRPC
jgi:hypothetical protein